MIRYRTFAFALAVALLGACTTGETQAQQSQNKTLYQRLGGYDAIAAVTDDFMARMGGDPQVNHFFGGISADSQRRLRQLIVDLLCQTSGGPCLYTGRTMKQSHTGLKITEADWNEAAANLTASLDKFKVPARENNEVLAIVTNLKPDIVEK